MDDSGGTRPYRRSDAPGWRPTEFGQGKTIKKKSFPKDHKVRVFRVELSIRRTVRAVADDRPGPP
jgi:hypothetical protein